MKESSIQEAARKPKLLFEFLNLWGVDRPSDAHCISELTLDRGFTDEAAKSFLRIYDDNLSFANLNGNDKINDVSNDEIQEVQGALNSDSGLLTRSADVPRSGGLVKIVERRHKADLQVYEKDIHASPPATLPLPEGVATLRIPSGLSERSVKALKAWIEVIVGLASTSTTDGNG